MQSLGSLEPGRSSGAYDINNNGDVVGYAYVTSLSYSTNFSTGKITITTNTVSHGFLYQNGAMVDLNSLISTNSGWVIQEAYSINDSGQILCEGQSNSGLFHSFILQVPEPSVSSLLIFGSAGIMMYHRKRRKVLRTRAFALTYKAFLSAIALFWLSVAAQSQTLTTIKSFGGADGAYPIGGVVSSNGVLYGATSGWAYEGPTIFRVNPDGTGFRVLLPLPPGRILLLACWCPIASYMEPQRNGDTTGEPYSE